MDKVTQRQRVLQVIQTEGYITRNMAADIIGCHELASRIGELESEGYKFKRTSKTGKNRFGDPTHWVEYRLLN